MRIKNYNNKWYSIIISLLMIGFLLVLTAWIFDLVLREMYDNRGMWSYIKAFAWAESWQELALLKINEKWYGIYDMIDHDVNNRSKVLSDDQEDFNRSRDVFISYDLETITSDYPWVLDPLWYDIIPLFYETSTWTFKISEINNFEINLWNPDDLAWNIVSEESWISWVSYNTIWFQKTINNSNNLWFSSSATMNSFLSTTSSEKNYLVLFNSNKYLELHYRIRSDNTFSKPKTEIISSGQIWNYKQNLRTKLNNTEYLNIIKYSIYSN